MRAQHSPASGACAHAPGPARYPSAAALALAAWWRHRWPTREEPGLRTPPPPARALAAGDVTGPRQAGGGASGASASRTAPSLSALSSGADTWWRHQASTHGEGAGRAGGASAGSELRGEGGERRRTEGDRGGAGRWRPEHGWTDPSVPGAQRRGGGQRQTCGLLQRGGARAGGRAVQQVTTVPPHRSAQAPLPARPGGVRPGRPAPEPRGCAWPGEGVHGPGGARALPRPWCAPATGWAQRRKSFWFGGLLPQVALAPQVARHRSRSC